MSWLGSFAGWCACGNGRDISHPHQEDEPDLQHYDIDPSLPSGKRILESDSHASTSGLSISESDSRRSRGSALEDGAITSSYEESAELQYEAEWHVRGVRIDGQYDFYDVALRKYDVRQTWEECPWPTSSSSAFLGTEKVRATSDTTSSTHSPFASSGSSDYTATSFPGAERHRGSELEIITNWGVLAGVLLHSRVVGFAHIVEKLQRHRKQSGVKGYRLMQSVERRAQAAVNTALEIARRVSLDSDCCDSEWSEDGLLVDLFGTEYIDTLMILANSVRNIISMQPMLAKAKVPCRIFGDLHGQFRDLLLFFHAYGCPDRESGPTIIFNGDFVDRGSHQLEVIGILFALKVLMPDKVWLLRGNHEDRLMNEKYGFRDDCRVRLGKEFGYKVYDHFHKAFDHLPVACVVANKVLVVHGGLGDGRWTLNDVEAIERPLNGDALYSSPVFNMLWSDPMDDEMEDGGSTFGVHSSPRRRDVVKFAWNVTKMFCARNGIGLIVRSHECKLGGMGFDVMHRSRLIRVFSARDYEGNGNSAAVLMITSSEAMARLSSGENAGTSPLLAVRPQVIHSVTQGCAAAKDAPLPSKKQNSSGRKSK